MKNVFVDKQLFDEIEKNGYSVINLLEKSDTDALKNIFNKHSIPSPEHFYSTSFLASKEERREISQEIQEIVRPKINNLLQNHKELGAVFLIKPTGQNTAMPIHQDWTVVEEPEFHSFTAWIPLQDTTIQNGTITVLPKSHYLSNKLRSPSLADPLKDIKELVAERMETLEIKSGQAFIFTHALIHASHANQSENNRIAVAYGFAHKDADLIYYHKSAEDTKLQKLSTPTDFFINYPEPGKQPKDSIFIEEIDYNETPVRKEEFIKFYGIKAVTFWGKLKEIFNR
ncbi:MAG: phytanoyl-CoA dioxygenase family protein [Chitinophagales bacterium]|nr:phytanoyl-CoA dioxygenase family protein [Chitinophagales bacterium]